MSQIPKLPYFYISNGRADAIKQKLGEYIDRVEDSDCGAGKLIYFSAINPVVLHGLWQLGYEHAEKVYNKQ
jgi:hypothetical protein